jgi:RNA polymerase-binding transcription factor DksA
MIRSVTSNYRASVRWLFLLPKKSFYTFEEQFVIIQALEFSVILVNKEKNMDKDLVEENKAKLLAEQKHLRGILSHEGNYDGKKEYPGEYKPSFPSLGDKEDENASEVAEYETNVAITSDMEKKLERVEAALKRITDGVYGKCLAGGDEIEPDRLRAVPEAENCLKHSK